MSVIAVGIVVATIGAAAGGLIMSWWLSGRVNKLQKEIDRLNDGFLFLENYCRQIENR